jgi:GxxExxY protein
MASLIHKELTEKVLGVAFAVHNVLGPGLLESAYEGALCVELAYRGLWFDRQSVFSLECRGSTWERTSRIWRWKTPSYWS